MRLVKKTVNFDDPYTYHLYYGDDLGRPGTLLTFFPWAGSRAGQRGIGQAATVSLSVPESSFGFWLGRLAERNITYSRGERFGEPVLAFEDPDGLSLELVPNKNVNSPAQEAVRGELEYAVRGIHNVTLWESDISKAGSLLEEQFGFRNIGEENGTTRFALSHSGPGSLVEIRHAEDFWPGVPGAGTVHHVAFRAEDDLEQQRLRNQLSDNGLNPTPVIDRQYFRSVYFREPGGILFEVATDPPGFTIDESPEQLGTALKLPPQYEAMRELLETSLQPLQVPHE